MKKIKSWIMRYPSFLIVIAVIAVATTSVSAYYIKNSGEVTNNFTPADSIEPIIEETFADNVKSNVYFNVGNTGYPVYVRAEIVITWQNKDGIVYFSEPKENTHYKLELNLSNTGWIKDGDYYYYQTPVNSGGDTGILIQKCELLNRDEKLPDGYTLNVDILVQTVQAIGYTDEKDNESVIPAYRDAWNKNLSLDELHYTAIFN